MIPSSHHANHPAHAPAAVRQDPRVVEAPPGSGPQPDRRRRGDRRGRRACHRQRRRRVRHDARRAARQSRTAALAAGASGGAARRLLHAGADHASGGRHELPRNLQRHDRRPHHGLRARLRTRLPPVLPAPASPRVAARAGRGERRDPPAGRHRPDRRRRRHRRGDGAAHGSVRPARDGGGRAAPRRAARRAKARWPRRARRPAAARGFRRADGAAHAGHRGIHAPGALPADEAHGLLHQHRPRPHDTTRRSGRRAPRRRDRGRRPRRLRTGAAARRSPAVDDARCDARRFLGNQPLRNVVDKANWF